MPAALVPSYVVKLHRPRAHAGDPVPKIKTKKETKGFFLVCKGTEMTALHAKLSLRSIFVKTIYSKPECSVNPFESTVDLRLRGQEIFIH